jgi:hypothetical protein
MVETKFPKFEWGTICEKNSGHTQSEWGTEQKQKNNKIIAYTVVWEK